MSREDYQIPIFVINLDRSPARMERIAAQLAKQKLAYTRIPAVDAKSKAFMSDERRPVVDYFGVPMLDAELANLRSHQTAWRTIFEQKLRAGIVLEDDAYFGQRFGKFASSTNWIPEDAEIIRLEEYYCEGQFDRRSIIRREGYRLLRLKRLVYNSAAYLVTRKGAQALMETRMSHNVNADQFLFTDTPDFRRLLTYQVDPAPCIQLGWVSDLRGSDEESTIDSDREALRARQIDGQKLTPSRRIMRRVSFELRRSPGRLRRLIDFDTHYFRVNFKE
jgi:glycosyl transferase family 25